MSEQGELLSPKAAEFVEWVKALQAALAWMVDNSIPQHTATCASQADDDPCICGVSERYEQVLELAAGEARGG